MNENQNNFNYQNQPQQPVYQNQAQQTSVLQVEQTKKDGKGKTSIILGFLSIFLPILGFVLLLILPKANMSIGILFILFIILDVIGEIISIIGLILGIISKSKQKILGIILNILGIITPIIIFILGIVFGVIGAFNYFSNYESDFDYDYSYGEGYEKTFENDDFSLTYNTSNWKPVVLQSGQDALQNDDLYLSPIGSSALSSAEKEYNCKWDSYSCKTTIYQGFYNYWDGNVGSISMNLYGGSNSFTLLKDDIYYATMDYGTSSSNIKGKMYLVISDEKNIILSFMSNMSYSSYSNDEKILELLKTITINDNFVAQAEQDELAGYLESMTNWNRYSSVRTGTLGTNLNINGGWRILSDSETYWTFKNNEFWWYKSVNDLNDNYWYGTTEIVTGKEGLAKVGLNENSIESITSQSGGKVTADNIHAIIMTPTKIISNGEDKSSTNIPEDSKWTYVWILVDHGSEGIEAQVLNVNTYDTSYYVKIND